MTTFFRTWQKILPLLFRTSPFPSEFSNLPSEKSAPSLVSIIGISGIIGIISFYPISLFSHSLIFLARRATTFGKVDYLDNQLSLVTL